MNRNANKINKRLRQIISRHELVDEPRIQEVLTNQVDMTLTQVLLDSGELEEGPFLAALAKETGIAPIDLEKVELPDDLLELLPENLARYYGAVPIAKTGKILSLAVSDPFDIVKLDDISMVTSCTIKPVLSTDYTIERLIPELYNAAKQQVQDLIDGMGDPQFEISEVDEPDEDEDFMSDSNTSPVIKLVNLIIFQGIRDKASDIHIEPFERYVRVRYRQDGVLKEAMQPPVKMLNPMVSRIKIMCGLDIAEKHRPQDGKFQLKIEGRQIDFRVSTLPMVHGEKVVMRILDSSNLALSLESLGFEAKSLADIRDAISKPWGMMLVTGPTGSGKSTTLYSSITEVLSETENIVTVEDPVEYQLEGVNQVPVNPKRGLTFAAALRSILRQDPDTVMIGEIRDLETIEIAIKAALTGHLVFSTLHTNDAPSTVTRMIDMGVDPFLVASATQCIAAQRLSRRLCNDCKKPMEVLPPVERLIALGFREAEIEEGLTIYEAQGCKLCSAGYKGRFALLETLPITEELRRLIITGASATAIKEAAIAEGLITLRRCGLENVKRGKTSIEELMRVTMAD